MADATSAKIFNEWFDSSSKGASEEEIARMRATAARIAREAGRVAESPTDETFEAKLLK